MSKKAKKSVRKPVKKTVQKPTSKTGKEVKTGISKAEGLMIKAVKAVATAQADIRKLITKLDDMDDRLTNMEGEVEELMPDHESSPEERSGRKLLHVVKVASHNSQACEFPFEHVPTAGEAIARAGLSAEGMLVKVDGEPALPNQKVRSGAVVYVHPDANKEWSTKKSEASSAIHVDSVNITCEQMQVASLGK